MKLKALVIAATLSLLNSAVAADYVYFVFNCEGKTALYTQAYGPKGMENSFQYDGVIYDQSGGTRRNVDNNGDLYVMQSAFKGQHVISLAATNAEIKAGKSRLIVDVNPPVDCKLIKREQW